MGRSSNQNPKPVTSRGEINGLIEDLTSGTPEVQEAAVTKIRAISDAIWSPLRKAREATEKLPPKEAEVVDLDEMASVMHKGVLFSFSGALDLMKAGHRMARASWGNPGKYVYLHPAEEMDDLETGEPVEVKPYLMWKNDAGKFVPWVASNDALLENDWFIGKSGEYQAIMRADAAERKRTHGCETPETHNAGCPCETSISLAR